MSDLLFSPGPQEYIETASLRPVCLSCLCLTVSPLPGPQEYIETASVKRPVLELALRQLQHLSSERRRVDREQRRADGRQ